MCAQRPAEPPKKARVKTKTSSRKCCALAPLAVLGQQRLVVASNFGLSARLNTPPPRLRVHGGWPFEKWLGSFVTTTYQSPDSTFLFLKFKDLRPFNAMGLT